MNGQERDVGSRIKRGLIVVIIGLIIWYLPRAGWSQTRSLASPGHLRGHHFRADPRSSPHGSGSHYWGDDDRPDRSSQNRPGAVWLCQQYGMADCSRLSGCPGIHHHRTGEENRFHISSGLSAERPWGWPMPSWPAIWSSPRHPFEHGPGRGDLIPDRPCAFQHL